MFLHIFLNHILCVSISSIIHLTGVELFVSRMAFIYFCKWTLFTAGSWGCACTSFFLYPQGAKDHKQTLTHVSDLPPVSKCAFWPTTQWKPGWLLAVQFIDTSNSDLDFKILPACLQNVQPDVFIGVKGITGLVCRIVLSVCKHAHQQKWKQTSDSLVWSFALLYLRFFCIVSLGCLLLTALCRYLFTKHCAVHSHKRSQHRR